jgi:hypothetical protein
MESRLGVLLHAPPGLFPAGPGVDRQHSLSRLRLTSSDYLATVRKQSANDFLERGIGTATCDAGPTGIREIFIRNYFLLNRLCLAR